MPSGAQIYSMHCHAMHFPWLACKVPIPSINDRATSKLRSPRRKPSVVYSGRIVPSHCFSLYMKPISKWRVEIYRAEKQQPSIELPKLQTTSPMSHHAFGVVSVLSFVALKLPAPWHQIFRWHTWLYLTMAVQVPFRDLKKSCRHNLTLLKWTGKTT